MGTASRFASHSIEITPSRQESVALIRHLSQGCGSTTRELFRRICRGRTSQSDLTLKEPLLELLLQDVLIKHVTKFR